MIARLVFLLILSTHIAAPLRAERVLTVFAAASLGGVLEEIVQDYPQQVVFSYGGSGAMARQVAAGAPADLVVLANPIWMEWLQDQDVAMQDTPVSIARNRLALIAGPAVQAGLEPGRVQELLGDGYLAIGQRNAVPAGIYARQWLQKTGQWDALEPHLAETDNVRAALALVAQGQAPAGIVYVTDAQAQPKVKILHIIEPGSHDPITYPAAALTPEGAALLSHFTKDPAQAIFAAHGFQGRQPMTLDAAAWEALRLSLWVACWATLLAIPLALWVAWLLARREFWGKSALNALVHLPLVLPPVVTGYLLLIAFGRNAPLGRTLEAIGLKLAFHWSGAVLAAIVMGFPLMVRAMRLAIEAVDPKLEEAAATLGAPRRGVFMRVTLPLITPGILAGAVMGFAKAMGEFGATITFVANIPGQTQTLPSAIWTALQIPGGEDQALMMVILASIVALGAVVLSEALARRVARRISGT